MFSPYRDHLLSIILCNNISCRRGTRVIRCLTRIVLYTEVYVQCEKLAKVVTNNVNLVRLTMVASLSHTPLSNKAGNMLQPSTYTVAKFKWKFETIFHRKMPLFSIYAIFLIRQCKIDRRKPPRQKTLISPAVLTELDVWQTDTDSKTLGDR